MRSFHHIASTALLLLLARAQTETTRGRYYVGAQSLAELKEGTYQFPEWSQPLGSRRWLRRTKNVGVSFSGGGSRAFGAAIGQIAALRHLEVWPLVRYATGTSGGSWALAAYSYRNRSAESLLGPIIEPSDLTAEVLARTYDACARSFPSHASSDYLNFEGEDWLVAAWRVFVGPAGVPENGTLGWLRSDANASSLYDAGNDPFPLFSTTLVGPATATPFSHEDYAALRVLASSPLYVGTPLVTLVSYADGSRVQVGGFVEPNIFGCDGLEPEAGQEEDQTVVTLETRRTCRGGMTVGDAAGFSSFYSGLGLATVFGRVANVKVGLHRTYYSGGGTASTTQNALFADGGNTENLHLSGLLQRGVRRIVAFFNTVQPLNLTWNPRERVPEPSDCADDLTDFFGFKSSPLANPTYVYSGDQFFPASDFADVAIKLQDSVRSGLGGVATAEHVTVDNENLGVPGGLRVNVTWVYLSPSTTWYDALPAETQAALAGREFAKFPHFDTLNLVLSESQVNALASLVSWVLVQNFDAHLADILLSPPTDSSSDVAGMSRDSLLRGAPRTAAKVEETAISPQTVY